MKSIFNSKRYPWVVVGLLWFVALLNYLDRQMIATMRPSMQLDIEELQSAVNFGRLMAVFLWIYAFVSPLAGIIADRLNRKWLIVSSLFVWSLVTLLMGFAKTFEQLYALRALMGFSEALYIPTGLALIADYHSPKTRSLAIGIHLTGLYMGQALGGFGAVIASSFSWRLAFQTFGAIGVVYALVLLFFLKEKRPVSADAQENTKTNTGKLPLLKVMGMLFTNISYWIILLYFTIPSLPGWAIKNWLPTLFANKLNIEMSVAGPVATIAIAGSSLIGVVLGGIMSDKWVQKNIRGRIYVGAIGLGLTIPALLFIGLGGSLFAVVAAAICFGFGFGMFDANNMPILCQFIESKYRATAYGIMNMAGVFAGAIITDLLGKSTDAGHLGRDFAILSIIVSFAVCIQLFFLKPKQQ